jgi:hypothetical protein
MITYSDLPTLHQKFNGPIPENLRLRALFRSTDEAADLYECARAGSMIQHYSAVSSALIKKIEGLGQSALALMQRHYHKQELSQLLGQRRKWKTYRQNLGDCPNN